MTNKEKKIRAVLLISSILVGLLISTQIEVNVIAQEPDSNKSIEEYKYDIHKTREDIDKLSIVIEENEKKLDLLEDNKNRDNNLMEILIEDFKTNKIHSGYSGMEGPGIEIVMYDNMDSDIIGIDVNDDIIHDIDILNIINDLKIAGAEALSVNDQRVISTSEIKCGGPIIKINGRSLGTPFIIRAIGNQDQLVAAISAPGTYGDILKNVYKLEFEAETKDHILIPSFDGIFRYNYAKPVEEGV